MAGRVGRWSLVCGDPTRLSLRRIRRPAGHRLVRHARRSNPSLPIAMALTQLAAARKDGLPNGVGLQFAVRNLRSDTLLYALVRTCRILFLLYFLYDRSPADTTSSVSGSRTMWTYRCRGRWPMYAPNLGAARQPRSAGSRWRGGMCDVLGRNQAGESGSSCRDHLVYRGRSVVPQDVLTGGRRQ